MLSFKLWVAYVRFAVHSITKYSRWPNVVSDSEMLGREIFSSKHIKKINNGVKPGLFLPKESNREALSVDRLSLAERQLLVALGRKHARKRTLRFYGFAEFAASEARQVKGDDGWRMDVRGTSTLTNPLHADLLIPDAKGKDYDLMIADQMCAIANFREP